MSEQEKETIESQSEIGEVTITEYRKSQMVRLAECFVVAPICIYAGVKYRKQLPAVLSWGLIGIGVATLLHSGSNFAKNWNRDGKLIRTAIKTKREEERKIREQKKKEGSEPKPAPAVAKKEEVKAPLEQKAPAVAENMSSANGTGKAELNGTVKTSTTTSNAPTVKEGLTPPKKTVTTPKKGKDAPKK